MPKGPPKIGGPLGAPHFWGGKFGECQNGNPRAKPKIWKVALLANWPVWKIKPGEKILLGLKMGLGESLGRKKGLEIILKIYFYFSIPISFQFIVVIVSYRFI